MRNFLPGENVLCEESILVSRLFPPGKRAHPSKEGNAMSHTGGERAQIASRFAVEEMLLRILTQPSRPGVTSAIT